MALNRTAIFGVGVLCGALVCGAVAAAGTALSSQDLDHRKAELTRISAELTTREAALAASQTRVHGQVQTIQLRVSEAAALADQLTTGQGSVIERLKKVTAAVRQLRDDLRGIQTSE
jgi:hypothetical protein